MIKLAIRRDGTVTTADAEAWFETAANADIAALARDAWHGPRADAVAIELAPLVRGIAAAIRTGGYTTSIDRAAAVAWLRERRPGLARLLAAEGLITEGR